MNKLVRGQTWDRPNRKANWSFCTWCDNQVIRDKGDFQWNPLRTILSQNHIWIANASLNRLRGILKLRFREVVTKEWFNIIRVTTLSNHDNHEVSQLPWDQLQHSRQPVQMRPILQFGCVVQWDHLKAAKCTHRTFSGNETPLSRKRLAEAFPTKNGRTA